MTQGPRAAGRPPPRPLQAADDALSSFSFHTLVSSGVWRKNVIISSFHSPSRRFGAPDPTPSSEIQEKSVTFNDNCRLN